MIALAEGDASLLLAPETGGSIASWTRGGVPIMRPSSAASLAEKSPRSLASYPLFPYSNRVANRRFTFAGQTHELPDLMGGWAIHGAGWQLPWQGTQTSPTDAAMLLEYEGGRLWPFAFAAEQHFAFSHDALICDLSITNLYTAPAPAGFGMHPYFPRGPRTKLTFSADAVWHNGTPDKIPVSSTAVPREWDHRAGRVVGTATLDNCFAGWGGTATIEEPDHGYRLTITADPIFRHLVVFIPEGEAFFAVEPVSNMNDGLNRMSADTDHGVFILPPGATQHGRVTYRLEQIAR